jgi:hypothetical protein
MKISFSFIFLASFLFLSGCSQKEIQNGKFNEDFKDFTKEKFQDTQAKDYLKASINEVIKDDEYIDIDTPKKLSFALNDLSDIEGTSYLLDPNSDDISLMPIKNSHRLKINSFKKLNEYIGDTSNYFLYVKKNRFLKNRIKMVSLKNKLSLEKNLSNIPFEIEGSKSVSDILEEVSRVSKFNISTRNAPRSDDKKVADKKTQTLFGDDSLKKLFETKYVSFSGNNIMELLNFISTTFNIYVEVDYENKIIIFQKVKFKIFNIVLNNVEYSGTLDVEKDVQNDVGSSGASAKAIKTKIKLDILDSFEKSLKSILQQSSEKSSVLSFNRTTGRIFVKTDKQSMDEISLLINDFNTIFSQQIDFKLDIYEFAVTKDFNAGISLGATLSKAKLDGSFTSSSISNSIFNMKYTQDSGNTASVTGVNFNTNIIRLVKQTRHGYILKNSIPYFIDTTDSKSYIKSIETTVTTTTAGSITATTPETSEMSEGTILSVLPRISGNKIELNIQPNIVRINSIAEATYDGNTITLPDVTSNTFRSNILFNDGETKIIGYLTTYQDVNDYNGMVPIENFIIGGAKSKEYFRKETVFVVSASIRD